MSLLLARGTGARKKEDGPPRVDIVTQNVEWLEAPESIQNVAIRKMDAPATAQYVEEEGAVAGSGDVVVRTRPTNKPVPAIQVPVL